MAKRSVIERNNKRKHMASLQDVKRRELRAKRRAADTGIEERVRISMQLAKMPRNGARVRVRNRCVLTGRGRGVYRFCGLNRIELRRMSSEGLMAGIVKSSW
ncbi:MAG: 30S ribosomal protein S14 [Alphaproteobacteria bacterium]|nr:30S ribosomal protein S14 [Alphaproteobacteria bacterium]